MSHRYRVTELLFLATVFTVTFAKVHWNVAGDMSLSDVLTALFLASFTLARLTGAGSRLTRAAAIAFLFFLAFCLVYLVGFFNLDTSQALAQWGKGMVKFVLHFGFLVAGVSLVVERGGRFYWRTLGVFCAGIVANAAYGVLQLGVALATGGNLDAAVLSPLTGGASQINVFGAVAGEDVYRPNALTGDPNHLGIELVIPLLVLLPVYLRLEPGHRWRVPLALVLAFCFVVELATLSRSGLLGLGAGLAVLALPYRRHLVSARFLAPLGAVCALVFAYVARRADFFETVLRARISTQGAGATTHFTVYGFIPDVLAHNPLFGFGLNNFSVYYEFVTGRTNFGPHSFYVAQLVETGLVGTIVFVAFVGFLFSRLATARRLGRALSAAGDTLAAARLRPLAWGLTAALVATLVANVFYLTMSFYYFFVFALLAITAPTAVARSRRADPPGGTDSNVERPA